VAAIVVVVAALSLYVFVLAPPPATQQPTHVYTVEGDSEWFDLPAGQSTGIYAFVTDNGAPKFAVTVNVSVNPSTEGVLSPTSAETDTSGIAHFSYLAYNRSANQSLAFHFNAVLGGALRNGSVEVRQLGIAQQPTTARAKGTILSSADRLPVANATIQVNLQNMTGLAVGTSSFYSNNSDTLGRYLVKDVPPRESLIQVFKSGFKSQHLNITLTPGKNTRVDFLMDPLTGKVLTIWHTYSGKEQDEFNKMVDRYRATRPDLNIQVEFQPYAGAPEKFIVAATAGNAPDVMRLQNDRLGGVASLGYLEPLDSRLTVPVKQLYTQDALRAMTIQGSIYALPATEDLLAIIYNKAIFDARSEPYPSDNWTTTDLLRIASNLTGGSTYGFVTPQTIGFYWFPWLTGYGGKIFTVPDTTPITGDADIGLNTDAGGKSVLFMQSLDKTYHYMYANPGEDPMLTDFLQGNAAMITTGPWNIPAIERAQINYGIAMYPIVSATGLRAAPTLGVKGFGIWKLSSVKDDAFDFIKYITSPEQEKIFALGTGGVPGTNDLPTTVQALSDPDIQANPVIARFLKQATMSSEFPSRPEMASIWDPVANALTFIYDQYNPDPADPGYAAAVQQAIDALTTAEQQVYG
jgi:arabinogalactan oligomer/maltooligosaccharide transport system substrate-binding protein